ncbi:Na+/H+ antiporter subunit E [Mycobacterium sp. 1081908.1]|uniref:Na+/H+ antiporter subunit E n=1 Tax=Mycobacterium sp. 1081908.1 TaxID=1834066 RepID=UPI0007FD402A|nr:Na+/H+ antiporter subunit E [Mycobacterium sp. 1081908.1]OBK43827.1 hypothetical protein A5655_15740 [Mycobacterium sp. 1081908.1]
MAAKREPLVQLLGEIGLWWLLTAGIWLATLSSRTWQELTVMAACTLPCAVMARSARRANAGRWRFRIAWLRWLAMAAGEVPRQAFRVWTYAATSRAPVIRHLPLPDEPARAAAARRAAAVLALVTTPGTVVLDSDPRTHSVLVHLIRRQPSRLETAVQR